MRSSALALFGLVTACGVAATPPPVAPVDLPAARPAASASAAPAVPDGYVHFAHVAPKPGVRYRVDTAAGSRYDELQGEFAGATYHADYTATLLEVSGDAPTKLEASVHESVRRVLGAEEYNEKPTGLKGRTIVVQAPGKVDAKDGAPLTADQTSHALYVFGDLGLRSRTSAALPDAPVKIGASVDPFAEAVVRSLNAVSWTPVRTSAVVTALRDGVATIALDLEASTASGMHLDAKGTAEVIAQSRVVRALVLEGTFRGPPPDRAPGKWDLVRRVAVDPTE